MPDTYPGMQTGREVIRDDTDDPVLYKRNLDDEPQQYDQPDQYQQGLLQYFQESVQDKILGVKLTNREVRANSVPKFKFLTKDGKQHLLWL